MLPLSQPDSVFVVLEEIGFHCTGQLCIARMWLRASPHPGCPCRLRCRAPCVPPNWPRTWGSHNGAGKVVSDSVGVYPLPEMVTNCLWELISHRRWKATFWLITGMTSMTPGSDGWISTVLADARVASCVGGFAKRGQRCTGRVDAAWEERVEAASLDGTFVCAGEASPSPEARDVRERQPRTLHRSTQCLGCRSGAGACCSAIFSKHRGRDWAMVGATLRAACVTCHRSTVPSVRWCGGRAKFDVCSAALALPSSAHSSSRWGLGAWHQLAFLHVLHCAASVRVELRQGC